MAGLMSEPQKVDQICWIASAAVSVSSSAVSKITQVWKANKATANATPVK